MFTPRRRFEAIDWAELYRESTLILGDGFSDHFRQARCVVFLCCSPFGIGSHVFSLFERSHFLLLETKRVDQRLLFFFNGLTVSYLDRWLFEGEVVLFVFGLHDTDRVIPTESSWYIAMEAHTISLVLAILRIAALPHARLGSPTTLLLHIRLLILVC